jgi:hypothetical protein
MTENTENADYYNQNPHNFQKITQLQIQKAIAKQKCTATQYSLLIYNQHLNLQIHHARIHTRTHAHELSNTQYHTN